MAFANPTPAAVVGGLTFATVSAGWQHACGVTISGAAYCWGDNQSGELCNGFTRCAATPVAVAGGLTFATVGAGADYTCGLTTSGIAYCWGSNFYSQLGSGTTANSPCSVDWSGTRFCTTPVAVAGGLTFASISVGGIHTCGVTTAGAAYCWGNPVGASPVAVRGGLSFATVSAGNDNGGGDASCGVTMSGVAYCWYGMDVPVKVAGQP
jgi:alpha-tubulin suppressor-like RCC1 family protein